MLNSKRTAGSEITEFPGVWDTQKLLETQFFNKDFRPDTLWISRRGFRKDSPLPFVKPERVSETQILGVGFRKETK